MTTKTAPRLKSICGGFTLIELMIVVTLIAVLTAIGFTQYKSFQGRTRDTQRKNDLKQVQLALLDYYQQNRTYPATTGGAWVFETTTNYIPSLVPSFLKSLPSDPKVNQDNSSNLAGCTASVHPGYYYKSNGTDYMLAAYCSIEADTASLNNTGSPLYCLNCAAPRVQWVVYSDGAKDWSYP